MNRDYALITEADLLMLRHAMQTGADEQDISDLYITDEG